MMRKTVLTAVGSAVLGGLGVGYLTLGPTANAERASIVDDSTTTTVAGTTEGAADQDPDQRFRDHVQEALAPLLADGTLTQAQIDKIVTALGDARPAGGEGHGRGRGGPGHGRGGPMIQARGEVLQLVADTIGITVDELTTALKGGSTIAEVATSKNVDPQKVIDTLVLSATQALDAKVADGTLSADRAAEIKANLVDKTTRFVNEGGPRHGKGPGHRDADEDDQTTTTATDSGS
jgi:hypothetical protein